MMTANKRLRLRAILIALCLPALYLAASPVSAQLPQLALKVSDPSGRPVPHLEIKLRKSTPGVSNGEGVVRLETGAGLGAGQFVTLYLVSQAQKGGNRWFLLSPWEGRAWQVPHTGQDPVPVTVARIGARDLLKNDAVLRQIATISVDRLPEQLRLAASPELQREAVLRRLAAETGIAAGEIDDALAAWARRVPDPLDAGIAALALGRLDEAESELERAAKEQQEKLVQSNRYLGQTRFLQADYAGALQAYSLVRVLAPDDLDIDNLIGMAHLEAGDYEAALTAFQKALERGRGLLGEDHPETLDTLSNLAATYQAAGQFPEAMGLLESIIERREATLGPGHPSTLSDQNSLATLLWEMGKRDEARALLEVAAKEHLSLKDGNPGVSLAMLSNLSQMKEQSGELAEAERLQREVLRMRREYLGTEHLSTLSSMNSLAVTLQKQGKLEEALALQQAALKSQERILGAEHPDTLALKSNLANLLVETGDLPAARRLLEEVLAARRTDLGSEHPRTLTSMNNLAMFLESQGDFARAEILLREALETQERTLGTTHPDSLSTRANLAVVLGSKGELEEARGLEEQVLAARRDTLGPGHPLTFLAEWNLLNTAIELEDKDAFLRHLDGLSPLLERDPAELSAQLREIQEELRRLVELTSGAPERKEP